MRTAWAAAGRVLPRSLAFRWAELFNRPRERGDLAAGFRDLDTIVVALFPQLEKALILLAGRGEIAGLFQQARELAG